MSSPPDLDVNERAALFDAIRAAAEGAGIGLAITDLSGGAPRNLFVNARLSEILGYDPQELLSREVWSMIAPDELPRLQEIARRQAAGEVAPTTTDTVVLHSSGTRVPVELAHGRAILEGRPVTATFLTDITARLAVTQALRESEKRFRDLVDGAPDGVVILRGPMLIFVNPRAAQLLGLPDAAAANGRMITDFLHPEDRERAATRIRHLLEKGGLDERAEYRSIDPQGELHTVEISSIPIQYQGAPAVLAFARDVTDRKRMQSKLLDADRLAALGVLSAGVAHEINNPLAYVLLNLEYLKRELPKVAADPSRVDALIVRVQDACHGAERVASIVRDLRTFARGEETARQPISVEAAIESAINVAQEELRSRARIERRYQTVPAVDGNVGRLEQVFMNLLINAAQAFEEGTTSDANLIRVTLRSDAESVIVEVSDNGPGISPELVGRIFDPFFTTKPVGVGTGLGLPICRGIVQTHGGEITVTSRPSGGTTFTVTLPASTMSPILPATPTQAVPGNDKRHRGRVLVVDDEAAVARTLKMLLQNEHDLEVAESGAEALQLLELPATLAYDAVLCDLMMPGMTGMELFEVLQRERPQLAARVVFMTGGVSMLRVAEFLEGVPNAKFEKPFDIAELRRTLHELVASARGDSARLPGVSS